MQWVLQCAQFRCYLMSKFCWSDNGRTTCWQLNECWKYRKMLSVIIPYFLFCVNKICNGISTWIYQFRALLMSFEHVIFVEQKFMILSNIQGLVLHILWRLQYYGRHISWFAHFTMYWYKIDSNHIQGTLSKNLLSISLPTN